MSDYRKVGDLLVDKGILTAEQRDEALKVKMADNRRLGEVIVSLGYASEREVVECLANQYDVPFVELNLIQPSPEATRLVSPTYALSRLVLPFKVTDRELHCILADPLDIELTDNLSQATGKRLVMTLAGPIELFEKISTVYGLAKETEEPKVAAKPTAKPAATKKKTVIKPPVQRRKVKVQEQDDRKQLLGAISAEKTSSVWDWYEVY